MRNMTLEWFQTRLSKIPSDKYVHLLTCQTIAYLLSWVLYPIMGRCGVFVSLPVTIAIGFFKEIRDDEFDYDDFKFDIIGSIWGVVLFLF